MTLPSRYSMRAAENSYHGSYNLWPYTSNVQPFFSDLKILPVRNIFEHETAKLIHSVFHRYNPTAYSDFFDLSTHTYTTRLRQNSTFSIMKPKTEMGKKSVKYFGVKIWIKLPLSLKELLEPKKFNLEFKKLQF